MRARAVWGIAAVLLVGAGVLWWVADDDDEPEFAMIPHEWPEEPPVQYVYYVDVTPGLGQVGMLRESPEDLWEEPRSVHLNADPEQLAQRLAEASLPAFRQGSNWEALPHRQQANGEVLRCVPWGYVLLDVQGVVTHVLADGLCSPWEGRPVVLFGEQRVGIRDWVFAGPLLAEDRDGFSWFWGPREWELDLVLEQEALEDSGGGLVRVHGGALAGLAPGEEVGLDTSLESPLERFGGRVCADVTVHAAGEAGSVWEVGQGQWARSRLEVRVGFSEPLVVGEVPHYGRDYDAILAQEAGWSVTWPFAPIDLDTHDPVSARLVVESGEVDSWDLALRWC